MRYRRLLARAAARAPLRRLMVRAAVCAAALIIVAPASAHVVVLPSVAPEGTPTEFTLQVPTERNLPTTSVRVMFPPQVSVYSFQVPSVGFTVTPILAKNQSIIGAVFRGTIPVGEYQAFHFLGTPFSTGQTLWPAYQTYADGLIKPWNGPVEKPGSVSVETGPTQPGPTSAVEIVKAGTSTVAATGGGSGGSGGTGSDSGIWLGIIAIVIAIGAAVAAGLLWATRPVRLRDDESDSAAT
jgi:uncharacterized protein YcnI